MRGSRLVPLLTFAVSAVALAVISLGFFQKAEAPRGLVVDETIASIGGPFELTTHQGERLTDQDLRGSPFAVFFGFTFCPEVCPTTLWEMTDALQSLGDDAANLKVLFITVDPERDTPEALERYLQSFDPRITGLTGTPEEIEAVSETYRVFSRKVPIDGGDYTMDHTATTYLMDSNGRFTSTISYEEQKQTRMEKLRLLAGR
ncbi:SCO family protein [Aureimonas fodinaquatilis]|uniref:SCO family protein n=1 Tax=Aureimonas fodinaquatilis TaxID=2565783 RepID=A0A5B0E1L9_9HYPH|nr:SCO family protein [Aureimonas fodinaquatilis]KAA0972192.1 SCO family protein [Aureimonas fodinaquatilis]